MIIAVEGMDGAGKTTLCSHIERTFNFINIDKPTKYMFTDANGNIDYKTYYETLDMIYKSNELSRCKFFGKGNLIAVTKYPNSNVVLDRHLASNFYWNATKKHYQFFEELIKICGKPDLTIYLDASPQTRYKRLKQRNIKDFDLYDNTIFADGREKNIEFLEHFNFNYRIIRTDNKSIKEVCREIDHIIKGLIMSEPTRKKMK